MKSIFKSKKKLFISIIAIVVGFFIFVNICASVFFSFAIFKKDGWKKFEEYSYGEQLKENSEWISEKGEKTEIENADGKSISALEITNEHISHSYVVICHQYGGSPYATEEYAKHFYEMGFNILLPYMRGHGNGSYKAVSFGWEDSSDIEAWVENIVKKDKNAKIALFGVSLGANAVTLAASEEMPDNVRLAISDSCYTSIEELVEEYVENETPFSDLLVSKLTSAFAKNKMGVSLKDADTVKKVRNIELPIMFINAENDIVVPPLLSKRLYENCEAEGVEEVLIENGTHGRNLEADKEAYWANIDAFILNNIGI
jgi:alpha-beta hydrolase superfamily lysophospholipase